MKGPGIFAALVIPALIVGVAGITISILAGCYWCAAWFVPGTIIAGAVVWFMWGRG